MQRKATKEIGGLTEHAGTTQALPGVPPGTDKDASGNLSVPEICIEILRLHDGRRLCIKSQRRANQAVEQFIARTVFRYKAPKEKTDDKALEKKEQQAAKAIFKITQAIRLSVEDPEHHKPPKIDLVYNKERLAECGDYILANKIGRASWDGLRERREAELVALVRKLPIWNAWGKDVKGLAEIGIASIIGEAGNLSNYQNEYIDVEYPEAGIVKHHRKRGYEKLYKRLGLAVMFGVRQGRVAKGISKEDRAALYSVHGYSPPRRSEVWNRAPPLIKAQIISSDRGLRLSAKQAGIELPKGLKGQDLIDAALEAGMNEIPEGSVASGPYGEVYLAAKKKALEPENEGKFVSGKHVHNHAARLMTKALIRDMWRAWRDTTPRTA